MFFLIFTREERISYEELIKDTAIAPHVNRSGIGDTQHDLWGAIETGLDVGVNLFILEAATAEIDYFDSEDDMEEKIIISVL